MSVHLEPGVYGLLGANGIAEVGRRPLSMKKKRYAIGTNTEKCLNELMNL